MKNKLLLGHSGYLGAYLAKNLECDTLRTREIYNNNNKYDFIINCIGKPNLLYCESHPFETNYSNCNVINDIKYYYPNVKIINFSSYYVYNDIGMCSEESNVINKYQYCAQKLQSESLNSDGLNFRIGKLFGESTTKQYKLTEHILQQKKIYVDTVMFNPTSLQCVLMVLQNDAFLKNESGIFNLSNEGIVSHYEYALYIIKQLNLKKQLYKINMQHDFENYGKFTMSINKIKKYFNINSWQKDMDLYLEGINV